MKKKKILIIVIIIAILTILLGIITYNIRPKEEENSNNEKSKSNKVELTRDDLSENITKGIIYENKIYMYEDYITGDTDTLYVADLDGTNKEIIIQGEQIRNMEPYFVYNNELYYYLGYEQTNKKINLKTKEITDLHNDHILLPQTIRNDTVIGGIDRRSAGKSEISYIKYDLKNKKSLITNNVNTKELYEKDYFYDFDDDKIYLVASTSNDRDTYKLYKNNDVLITLPSSLNIYIATKNTLYLGKSNIIYKYDKKEKTLEGPINVNLNAEYDIFERMASGDNNINYFYVKEKNQELGKIYEFNTSSDKFELILDNQDSENDRVYKRGDYLIFDDNYYTEKMIKYNTKTKKVKEYTNIYKHNIDENNLYVLTREDKEDEGIYAHYKYKMIKAKLK